MRLTSSQRQDNPQDALPVWGLATVKLRTLLHRLTPFVLTVLLCLMQVAQGSAFAVHLMSKAGHVHDKKPHTTAMQGHTRGLTSHTETPLIDAPSKKCGGSGHCLAAAQPALPISSPKTGAELPHQTHTFVRHDFATRNPEPPEPRPRWLV
jgi:hypothetical protein